MELKTIFINGVEYFPATECAKLLGYTKPLNAIDRHCKKDGSIFYKVKDRLNRIQNKKFINKNNLLLLINKSELLSTSEKESLINTLIMNEKVHIVTSRDEVEFYKKLESFLKPFNIKIEKQYSVLNYRIDIYLDKYNLAIEYDENDHKYYSVENELKREQEIIDELGCSFIRLSDLNSDEYNLGVVMNKIIELSKLNNVI